MVWSDLTSWSNPTTLKWSKVIGGVLEWWVGLTCLTWLTVAAVVINSCVHTRLCRRDKGRFWWRSAATAEFKLSHENTENTMGGQTRPEHSSLPDWRTRARTTNRGKYWNPPSVVGIINWLTTRHHQLSVFLSLPYLYFYYWDLTLAQCLTLLKY